MPFPASMDLTIMMMLFLNYQILCDSIKYTTRQKTNNIHLIRSLRKYMITMDHI